MTTTIHLPIRRLATAGSLSLLLLATSAFAAPSDHPFPGGPGGDRGNHQDNAPQPSAPAPSNPAPVTPAPVQNTPSRKDNHDRGREQVRNDHNDRRDDHRGRGDDNHRWRDHDRRDDRRTNVSIYYEPAQRYSTPYYYRPIPAYVPAAHAYRNPYRPYYYSNYYVQRPIPVEVSQPYVEVRCGNQPITGTIVGGVAGGLIGNQFGHGGGRTASTIGGALLGAILGQSIDRADESCAYQALEYAEPNTQVVWADPETDYSYTITPGPVTDAGNGRYCREYQAKILVGGQLQDGYGQACRQPDGSWEVIN